MELHFNNTFDGLAQMEKRIESLTKTDTDNSLIDDLKAIFHLSKKVARKKSRIESYLFDFEKSSRSILVIAQ